MNSHIGVALRSKSRFARNFEERISKRLFKKKKSEGDHSEIEDYLDAYIGSKEQVQKQAKSNTSRVITPNESYPWGRVFIYGVFFILALNFFTSDRGSFILKSILNLKDSEKLNNFIVNGPSTLNQDLSEVDKDSNSASNDVTEGADPNEVLPQKNSLLRTEKKSRKKVSRKPAQNKKWIGAKPKKQLKKSRPEQSQIRD